MPGGLGVFETVMLLALRPGTSGPAIVGSLLVFRAVYYLLPLVLATGLLAAYEALQRRERLGELGAIFGRWAPEIAPRVSGGDHLHRRRHPVAVGRHANARTADSTSCRISFPFR